MMIMRPWQLLCLPASLAASCAVCCNATARLCNCDAAELNLSLIGPLIVTKDRVTDRQAGLAQTRHSSGSIITVLFAQQFFPVSMALYFLPASNGSSAHSFYPSHLESNFFFFFETWCFAYRSRKSQSPISGSARSVDSSSRSCQSNPIVLSYPALSRIEIAFTNELAHCGMARA